MSIAIDARMIEIAGNGVYLRNILPEFIRKADSIPIFLLGDPDLLKKYSWTSAKNVKVIDFRPPLYSIREQIRFRLKIPRKTDLFWAPHYNIPLLFRGKLVVTVHDLCHLALPEIFSGVLKRTYSNVMFRAISRLADRVITVSEFTAGEPVRFTGVNRTKITVIYNNLNNEWLNNTLVNKASPYTVPYLLYVGNIKLHKNLKNLLRAFKRVMHLIPHQLVIVGNRNGFITGDKEVIEMAGEPSGRVSFTGYIDQEELKRRYIFADGLLFPSLYEGFGFPPLEAMACGCPVLVSNVSALPEVCGDAALYCNPYEINDISTGILTLVQDVDVRQQLITNGKNQVAKFSSGCNKHTINTILDVYDS